MKTILLYLLKVLMTLLFVVLLTDGLAAHYHLPSPGWKVCFAGLMLLDSLGKVLRGEMTKVE